MTFLDAFDVILLDLNGTFMFGLDRFGSAQDYYATYRAQGGTRMDRHAVMTTMATRLDTLLRVCEDTAYFEDFPTLSEAFIEFAGAHEIVEVPRAYATMLQRLSHTHRLVVVSNICGDPVTWRAHFAVVGLTSVFTSTVFSSEGRSIKPSPRIFQQALAPVRPLRR